MLSLKANQHHLIKFAAVGVPLVLILSTRNLSNHFHLIWQMLLQSDMGNAIAAVVAVGGYLLDAWNNRKAQLLEAQIQRVQAQSQQLLVPVTTQIHALHMAIIHFVDQQISLSPSMQSSLYKYLEQPLQKEIIGSPILQQSTAFRHPEAPILVMEDILLRQREEGLNAAGLPFAPNITVAREVPQVIEQAIRNSDRPNDPVWMAYERFVRHELVPAVDRVAEIINENGHLMEPVPPEKLCEIFASTHNGFGYLWQVAPRMWFYSAWLAYARSWQTLLASWDDGDYTQIRPGAVFPIGTLFFNIEAQTIVAQVEKSLVGMSQMHGHGA